MGEGNMMKKFEVSENNGELSFGVMWISLDGRPNIKWYQTFEAVKEHYYSLKDLGRQPSMIIRLKEEDLK